MPDPHDDVTEEFSPLEQLCLQILQLQQALALSEGIARWQAERYGEEARRLAALLEGRFEVAAVSEDGPQTMTGVCESTAMRLTGSLKQEWVDSRGNVLAKIEGVFDQPATFHPTFPGQSDFWATHRLKDPREFRMADLPDVKKALEAKPPDTE